VKFQNLVFALVFLFLISSCSFQKQPTDTAKTKPTKSSETSSNTPQPKDEIDFCNTNNKTRTDFGLKIIDCNLMKAAARETCTEITNSGLDEYLNGFAIVLNSKQDFSENQTIAVTYLLTTSVMTYCPKYFDALESKVSPDFKTKSSI
jgi:hypothetical protein